MRVKCKTCKKRAFPSADAAITFIRETKDSCRRIYQCKENGTWHLTSFEGRVVIRKAFGGKKWEVYNGRNSWKHNTYPQAVQAAVKATNKYAKDYNQSFKVVL